MPYASIGDLPPGLRKRLPDHAQEIFRAAFNHAWQDHDDASDREAAAHRIAWAAVKHRYMRQGDRWVEKP
jgi:cation transport regulator